MAQEPWVASTRFQGEPMNMSPELHAALARIDAELHSLSGSIRSLLAPGAEARREADLPANTLLAQYRLLENAIHSPEPLQDAGPAAPQPAMASPSQWPVRSSPGDGVLTLEPAVALGSTGWTLKEVGWTLNAPDGKGRLHLDEDERAMLLHIAQAPGNRICLGDVQALLGVPEALRSSENEVSMRHVFIVHRLRARLKLLGYRLPLRALREGGYSLVENLSSSPRRDSRPAQRTHGTSRTWPESPGSGPSRCIPLDLETSTS
jgi:hypothetical protein